MNTDQIQSLINQADIAAQNENWEKALELLNQVLRIEPLHAGALTGKGTLLLHLNRVEEAVLSLEQALELSPDIPEAYNNLGVAYLINQDLAKAELTFKEALWLDDDNVQAWKNLAQVYLNQQDRLTEGVQVLASIIQAHPDDIDSLLQLGLLYEIGGEIESAETMLKQVLSLEPDNMQAQQIMADIRENKRTEGIAKQIARPEHASKLAGLKSLIDLGSKKPAVSPQQPQARSTPSVSARPPLKKIILFSPDVYAGNERLPALQAFYRKEGFDVDFVGTFSKERLDQSDKVIFYNPNLSGILVDAINHCIQAEKEYFVDIDMDFHNIPPDHPAYAQFGPGNPNSLEVVRIILEDAARVTTPSSLLADRYQSFCKRIEVALPAWDPTDIYWNQPILSRDSINIGWLGAKADIAALQSIQKPLFRFFKETKNANWVSVGSEEAYDLMPDLDEDRRLYLPPPTEEALGYIFTNFDVLLIPLAINEFNRVKSDLLLMYAGIRRIPWVASPIPAYLDWETGGFIAESEQEWYSYLKKLAEDPGLREEFGSAGRVKAEQRQVR